MNTLDRLDGTFPHGLPVGYERGCRGAGGCPNNRTELPICRDAWIRYHSDWTYTARVNRGLSPVEILAEEQAEILAKKVAAAEARRAIETEVETQHLVIERVQAKPKLDARKLVPATRKVAVAKTPIRPGLTVQRVRPKVRVEKVPVKRLQDAPNVAQSAVRDTVEQLDRLPKVRASKRPREVKPHGTNASFARGCKKHEDCPNFGTNLQTCYEANRAFYREYMRIRRSADIPFERHGTPYGYQLGCKVRESCPANPTCSDVSLAEDTRRRRERGVPEKTPSVLAEPVREHVRQLMAGGLSLVKIAERAGVSKSSTKTLLYGRSGTRKGPLPTWVSVTNADRLMAVTA